MTTIRVQRARCFVIGLAILLTTSGESVSAQAIRMGDSAGVRIVENPSRAGAPTTFRLGTTPLLDLGGPEEPTDNEFSPREYFLRAARLSTNGFAVIDGSRIHFFDAQGQRVRIIGRRGAGPREFDWLMSVCRSRGDTIVVGDGRNARYAAVDPSGVIVRTVRHAEHGAPTASACLDDGTLLLQHSTFELGKDTKTRVERVRLDGTLVNTLGEFFFLPRDLVTQSETTILAWKDRVYIGAARSSEVLVFNPGGQLMQIIRSADPPRRITAADIERRLRMTIPVGTSSSETEERMARMRAHPHASVWPAYRQVHVDPEGTMWVQDYVVQYPSDDNWTAFDAQGRLLGRLTIPHERYFHVFGFGVNHVMVHRRDDDGFAHLTLFPIETIKR